jgi:glycogen operon protein
MLLMGDEVRRTQRGNNNAYCQDSEISWFDWNLLDRHPDVLRFTRMLVAFRLRRHVAEEDGLTLNELLRLAQIRWHGLRLDQPDWADDSHSLACTFRSIRGRFFIHVMINAYWESLRFEFPLMVESGARPHRWIDTALDAGLPEWVAPYCRIWLAVQPRSASFYSLP